MTPARFARRPDGEHVDDVLFLAPMLARARGGDGDEQLVGARARS